MAAPTRPALANDAWEALMTAHSILMKGFVEEDIWQDVSIREYDVLYALSKRSRALSISELHRGVLLSQPGLSRMIDRLVVRGLVERGADEVDSRSVRVSLTEAGRTCQRTIGSKHARQVARAMAPLDASEAAELLALCNKLVFAAEEGRQ